jgi:hypothetical protein
VDDDWTANQFSVNGRIREVPKLLRNVADEIEQLGPAVDILDIAVSISADDSDVRVGVYWAPLEN